MCSSTYFKVREGQVIQSILQSPFVLRAPLASCSPEETHRLLQPLHRVVVVSLLIRHLWKHLGYLKITILDI